MPEIHKNIQLDIMDTYGHTGHSYQELTRLYELPKKLRNKKVLDVCAGLSDFSGWLRDRGAESYAFDLGYGYGIPNFIGRSYAMAEENEVQEPGATEIAEENIEYFLRNVRRRPGFYVAGSAVDLPFRKSYFDFVFSNLGILGALDWDMDLLRNATNEALRVLNKGGELQMGPLIYGATSQYAQNEQNQRNLLHELKANGAFSVSEKQVAVAEEMGQRLGRLTIVKIR